MIAERWFLDLWECLPKKSMKVKISKWQPSGSQNVLFYQTKPMQKICSEKMWRPAIFNGKMSKIQHTQHFGSPQALDYIMVKQRWGRKDVDQYDDPDVDHCDGHYDDPDVDEGDKVNLEDGFDGAPA